MKNSKYGWYAKNYGKDNIYTTRLRLCEKYNYNIHLSADFYSYIMAAKLGIILIDFNKSH